MLGTLHNDLYFQRMAASLGDKARLIDWLVKGPTLDVGAGDGALVAAMQQANGDRAYGLDASGESVARSNGLVRLGTSPGIGIAFPGMMFSNVVMSAVLHEIFSYNQPRGIRVSMMAVEEAAWKLKPQGRLLIRDGIGPDDPTTLCRITFRHPGQGARFHARWHELSRGLGLNRPSSMTWLGLDGRLYGQARHITAFLFVYVWGEASIEREAQEDYTCAGPLHMRSSQLEAWTGLDLIHAESYQQPGYVENWTKLCSFEQQVPAHEGPWSARDWPMTNAIWILQNNNEDPEAIRLEEQEEDDHDQ